jgi:hypothetical protein
MLWQSLGHTNALATLPLWHVTKVLPLHQVPSALPAHDLVGSKGAALHESATPLALLWQP